MDDVLSQWSEAIMSSLATAMGLLFSAAPKILGFVFIVLIGWLLATLVEKGVAALLRTIRFNDLAERSGLANFVRKMGTESDLTGMIGAVTKWFIRLIALVVAFDALGLPAVSDVLRQLLMWLPHVVVALVVLVIGGLAARALGNLVRGAAAEGGWAIRSFWRKSPIRWCGSLPLWWQSTRSGSPPSWSTPCSWRWWARWPWRWDWRSDWGDATLLRGSCSGGTNRARWRPHAAPPRRQAAAPAGLAVAGGAGSSLPRRVQAPAVPASAVPALATPAKP
jgi:hypothetical protein